MEIPEEQIECHTAESALKGLTEIHNDVQDKFHDQWEWMDAFFFVEVLRVCIENRDDRLAASEAEVKRLREALAFVLPFAEKELECRETSYLPEPLDEAEEGYLTEAQEAVSVIRAALDGEDIKMMLQPREDTDNGK